MTRQETLNKVRSIFARAALTNFDGEFETAYQMAARLMKQHSLDEWDITYTPFSNRTEADYVLHNFKTAQARWEQMDKAEQETTTEARQTATEKPEAEPGYKLVWVNGHKRTSKRGTVYTVQGHYRKIKIKAS